MILRILAVLLLGLTAAAAHAADKKPNLLLILVDDMGYSDVGAYGSEGVLFTNFHVAATCSPTRSMLITGADNHVVGYGNMQEILADNQVG